MNSDSVLTSCVVFSHGKDGEPWGTKVIALAQIARDLGWRVESIDYRGMDDPQARVDALREACRSLPPRPVLVGSSLGGHVATVIASEVAARGLFLLAPAFYMPGFEQYTPQPPDCPITIVHGWNDDIVPVDNSWRWARAAKARLHVIDSDHRMSADITDLSRYFEHFLQSLS
jgi:pimeloyl-ACP methyl ester carboxylesterase